MGRRKGIGRAELEVLRYVAEHPSITAREVADHLAATKGLARSTILTVMERLRSKGYLTRDLVEDLYRYSPTRPRHELLRDLVGDFVDTALGGSLSPFMAYLARDAQLTDAEREELRRILDEHDARSSEEEP